MQNNRTDLVPLSENAEESSAHDAKLAAAYYNQAIGYLEINQLDLAAPAAVTAAQMDPTYQPISEPLKHGYYIRGLNFLKENNLDDAAHAFRCAIAIDATFVAAHCELGDVYLKQGNLAAAQVLLEEAVQSGVELYDLYPLSENVKRAYVERGCIRRDERRYEEAISDFQNAIELAPDSAEVHCESVRPYIVQLNDNETVVTMQDTERTNLLRLATQAIENALRVDPNDESTCGLSDAIEELWLEEDAYQCCRGYLEEELLSNLRKTAKTCRFLFNCIETDLTDLFTGTGDKNVEDSDLSPRYSEVWAELLGMVYDYEDYFPQHSFHPSGTRSSQFRDWPWRIILRVNRYLELKLELWWYWSSAPESRI